MEVAISCIVQISKHRTYFLKRFSKTIFHIILNPSYLAQRSAFIHPENVKKAFGFLTFLEGIEMEHWTKID